MLLYSPQPVTWTRCISILCTCHVWYFRIIVSFLYITFPVLYMFLYFTCSCTLHSCTIFHVFIFLYYFSVLSCSFLYIFSCTPVHISYHVHVSLPRTVLCSAPDWISCRYACRISFYPMGQSPGS
ncbi:putative serine/arginine repetitive matrix protein 5 isoform X2 [Iris pallida]|uniref:Serine/arginine repetitive matrix protein 5 isoform X2 n=1 Tax=Iris pallida TaxID=29817 RepID=A0AAX6I684_IRIPA|nr:putative serine/arginine repetitive matrix protein 5 isoform X2 [Iris pallida]